MGLVVGAQVGLFVASSIGAEFCWKLSVQKHVFFFFFLFPGKLVLKSTAILRPMPLRGAKLGMCGLTGLTLQELVRIRRYQDHPIKELQNVVPDFNRTDSCKDQKHRVYIIFYNAALILNLVMDIALQGRSSNVLI